MTLVQILIFILFGLLAGRYGGQRWRGWLLLVGSVLAIYWLQPGLPIRNMDFWLPTAMLVISVFVWVVTRPKTDTTFTRQDLTVLWVLAGLILGLGLTRLIEPLCCLTATRPPPVLQIVLALLFVGIGAILLHRAGRRLPWINIFFVVGLIALFILVKSEPLAEEVSGLLRRIMQQNQNLASALDVRWLGFSYVIFRLIHVLRDRLAGRLPEVCLGDFLTFILFYPAYTAGPIDRLQRFTPELRRDYRLSGLEVRSAGERLTWGIFKKFVLADTLALIALNQQNATQINSPFWMWVVLYAYAFLIYFDFSGYTDVAIGLGLLTGVRLPENFNRPYLQKNLTIFWNSWHMTLAQWFRAYYFNPLTRFLRSTPRNLPVVLIILLGQVTTMLLIGLWHGITWNFAAWGLWHGVGLFVHNRWSEALRARSVVKPMGKRYATLLQVGSVVLTFQFVTLGWVWFCLPTPELVWQVFGVLFGIL
jgi:alginate O-acetyltransferase complex protein AlgI